MFRVWYERAKDALAIRNLLERAFGKSTEASLVNALRQSGDAVVSVVDVCEGRIVGSLLLSRLTAPMPAVALAPIGVSPELEGRGLSSALIGRTVDIARERDIEAVIVVGDPGYYELSGFSAQAAAGYQCAYARPYLMVLVHGKNVPHVGTVCFFKPFNDLEGWRDESLQVRQD